MRKMRSAFTLVEILIVVIVLGILAAIVVPQFTDASTDAKDSSLATNLQIIRGQIELYKIQHGSYPPLATFATAMTTKVGNYGPYLQAVPSNPHWSGAAAQSASVSAGASGTSAWYYNETTGEFKANH